MTDEQIALTCVFSCVVLCLLFIVVGLCVHRFFDHKEIMAGKRIPKEYDGPPYDE